MGVPKSKLLRTMDELTCNSSCGQGIYIVVSFSSSFLLA